MGSLVTLIIMVALIAWIARSAYLGRAYRGLYLAAAMVSVVLSFGCFSIIPSDRDLDIARASGDQAQIAGTGAIQAIGPSLGLIWAGACFGALLGSIMYRKTAGGQI